MCYTVVTGVHIKDRSIDKFNTNISNRKKGASLAHLTRQRFHSEASTRVGRQLVVHDKSKAVWLPNESKQTDLLFFIIYFTY